MVAVAVHPQTETSQRASWPPPQAYIQRVLPLHGRQSCRRELQTNAQARPQRRIVCCHRLGHNSMVMPEQYLQPNPAQSSAAPLFSHGSKCHVSSPCAAPGAVTSIDRCKQAGRRTKTETRKRKTTNCDSLHVPIPIFPSHRWSWAA